MNSMVPNFFVDTHFHVFAAGVSVAGARYVPDYSARLPDWAAAAQRAAAQSAADVPAKGVVVQTSFLGFDNTQMLAAVASNPTQLRGVAVLPPTVTVQDLRSLHAQGVQGIRLNLAGASHDVSAWGAANAASAWREMAHLGWHAELHTDQGALPSVLAQLPPDLCAGVPLVLDHMAKPSQVSAQDATVQAVAQRAKAGKVYVKLSGAYRLNGVNAGGASAVDPCALAPLWLDTLGEAALLWGSDWPCTNHEALADYPQLLGALWQWLGARLTPSVQQAILWDNPMRVYWGLSLT